MQFAAGAAATFTGGYVLVIKLTEESMECFEKNLGFVIPSDYKGFMMRDNVGNDNHVNWEKDENL